MLQKTAGTKTSRTTLNVYVAENNFKVKQNEQENPNGMSSTRSPEKKNKPSPDLQMVMD